MHGLFCRWMNFNFLVNKKIKKLKIDINNNDKYDLI